MKVNKKEKDVEKITISYSDGTIKEIPKGAIVTLDQYNKEIKMNMEFKSMSGTDLINMCYGIMEFAANAGMLKDLED